jgi:hypothetical protein
VSFRIEHLHPKPASPVDVPAEPPHSLHAINGQARFLTKGGLPIGASQRSCRSV